MQSKADGNKVLSSLWSARIIPWVLTGVVGYATYVLVALLSVNYLLRKHDNHGAAIPILVIYFILFTLMAASFFRLVYVTIADPPYVPLGPSAPPARRDRVRYNVEKGAKHKGDGIAMGEYDAGDISGEHEGLNDPDSPGLERFYTKDVFTCEMDGRPSWCSSCATWKPDRAHHCSSSGRCITKMDHFCPWIGGPIGENNFKFFIQFNFYAALYCTHLLVVMAIYVRRQIVTEGESLNHHFAAILALAGMFGMFTGSMFGTCTFLAINNLTQVEKLGSRTRAYRLAVLKPSTKELQHITPSAHPQVAYQEITYPLDNNQYTYPDMRRPQIPMSMPTVPDVSHPDQNASREPIRSPAQPGAILDGTRIQPRPPTSARDMMAVRTFAILEMKAGENPWDLGSPLRNIETVMGTSIVDFLLPIKRSPCCYHEDPESYYDLGPAVDRLKASHSLMNAENIRPSDGPGHSKPSAKVSQSLP